LRLEIKQYNMKDEAVRVNRKNLKNKDVKRL
jgi:hypothetical protein